jgi:hypothetical protein
MAISKRFYKKKKKRRKIFMKQESGEVQMCRCILMIRIEFSIKLGIFFYRPNARGWGLFKDMKTYFRPNQ